MAESWIRMRGSLVSNPRVIAMARALLADPDFLDWYGHDGVTLDASRSVTMRHVTVVTRVTVGALTSLWSMVNECAGRDGVVTRVTLFEVDGMAGVPGIGKAMVSVGWLEELPDGVCFPNFCEHNTVTESRSAGAKTSAQRSREYRNRHKDSVTDTVTNSSRDASRDGVTESCDASRDAVTTEKSREEKSIKEEPNGSSSKSRLPNCPKQSIVDLYHELLPELPRVVVMDAQREKAILSLWRWVLTTKKPSGEPRATTVDGALAWFRDYFERARGNDFIMGRGFRSPEHANWKATIEYIVSPKGMKKIIEETMEVTA